MACLATAAPRAASARIGASDVQGRNASRGAVGRRRLAPAALEWGAAAREGAAIDQVTGWAGPAPPLVNRGASVDQLEIDRLGAAAALVLFGLEG